MSSPAGSDRSRAVYRNGYLPGDRIGGHRPGTVDRDVQRSRDGGGRRASDPNQQRENDLRHRLIRVRKSIDRLVNAYQEELITIDELRDRTPELRRQDQALNRELQSAVDRAKDRETTQAAGFQLGMDPRRAVARISKRSVTKLMRENGIRPPRRRRRAPITTDSRHSHAIAPNLLDRNFEAVAPDAAWLADGVVTLLNGRAANWHTVAELQKTWELRRAEIDAGREITERVECRFTRNPLGN